MFRQPRIRRLLIALLLVLQGCASEAPIRTSRGNVLEFVAEHTPPLVLRVPSGQPIAAETPSAMAELGMGVLGGVGGFLYTLPYLYGLGIVFVPIGIAQGAMYASEVSSCKDQWGGQIDDIVKWLQSNSAFLEKRVKSKLELRGHKSISLTTIPLVRQNPELDGEDKKRFREISERAASPVLLIGTIQMAFVVDRGDPMTPIKCGVKFRADASVEARSVAVGVSDEIVGPVSISVARFLDDPESIQQGQKNPESPLLQVQQILDDLAEGIAALYPKRNTDASLPAKNQ